MTEQTKQNSRKIMVGIGASAGGLEALRAMVPNLPSHENVVYVLTQHLDPKHSSMLASILARETDLPVEEITDGQVLNSSTLYIVPPAVDAIYREGRIFLTAATGVGPKPSIDRFFHSLSENHGERTIGIILSGTGSDGVHGVRAIKAEGGITIAQDESTAKFNNMPYAAISTGHIDLVLSPQEIPLKIKELIEQPGDYLLRPEPETSSEDDIERILLLLMAQTGSDFRDYKRTTLLRRFERRMTVHKCATVKDYLAYLDETPEELYELHNDILISVTSFFRDPDTFDALRKQLNAIILKDTDQQNELRIWVAGCTTGEEAYSIAIMIAEYLGRRMTHYKVQIFGTDLYDASLSTARQGIYPSASLANIPKKLVDKYFIQKDNNTHQLTMMIRNMVVFAKHNLVCDPPFSNLDLISCRNVLIYFNQHLQKNVLESFHYALRSGGLLFLGRSETVGNCDNLFTALDRKARIYRHRDEIKSRLPYNVQSRPLHGQPISPAMRKERKSSINETLDRLIADIYKPDCVLLNEYNEIVYLKGNLSGYLYLREGQMETDLLELIHPSLRQELRSLLYKSRNTDELIASRLIPSELITSVGGIPSESENLISESKEAEGSDNELSSDDEPVWMTKIRVRSFPEGSFNSESPLTLVIFSQENVTQTQTVFNSNGSDDERVKYLERELKETRESLQTTIEELETSNEELQSTYEEAQSTNEELYTSTEELQTSNEELQSTNEELRTVNQELSVKSSELEDANERYAHSNEQLQITNERLSREIEERKLIQRQLDDERKKLSTIINEQPTWVNICDPSGVILEVNHAGLHIMEADDESQLLGKQFADFVQGDDQKKLINCLHSLSEPGETRQDTLDVKSLKGNMRCLETNSAMFVHSDGEPRIVSIISDQTERRQTERLLQERQKELNHIMRLNSLGEMASGLAHELNQPLSAIASYIQGCKLRLEKDNCDHKSVRDVIDLASEQIKRASEILKHTQRFVRKDNHYEGLETVDLNEVIHTTVNLFMTTGQYTREQIQLELDENLPPSTMNPIQIEQVLINLIRNAFESQSNSNAIHPIKIRTQLDKTAGRYFMRVAVIDHGEGIEEDKQAELFKPFHTTKREGMGMGLSISRSIVEAHGGNLEGFNNRNQGATFTFTLPVDDAA